MPPRRRPCRPGRSTCTASKKMSRLIFGACATDGHNADSILDSAGEIRTLCEGKTLQVPGWLGVGRKCFCEFLDSYRNTGKYVVQARFTQPSTRIFMHSCTPFHFQTLKWKIHPSAAIKPPLRNNPKKKILKAASFFYLLPGSPLPKEYLLDATVQ